MRCPRLKVLPLMFRITWSCVHGIYWIWGRLQTNQTYPSRTPTKIKTYPPPTTLRPPTSTFFTRFACGFSAASRFLVHLQPFYAPNAVLEHKIITSFNGWTLYSISNIETAAAYCRLCTVILSNEIVCMRLYLSENSFLESKKMRYSCESKARAHILPAYKIVHKSNAFNQAHSACMF